MIHSILHIRPGVTTVIGSGGKTTLLETLGRELSEGGARVILCTTTHIFPFETIPCVTEPSQLEAALLKHPLICTGTPCSSGKLTAPACTMKDLAALADYVLVEGDGSKGLPLKAHLAHEPVIPPESDQTICVAGLSGVNRPICEAVHRPERFAALAGISFHASASPEAVAKVLKAEALADRYLLNQAEDPQCRRFGGEIQRYFPEALMVSLGTGEVFL